MFDCGECKRTTKPGEKATRVVVEMRAATYPFRESALRFRKEGKRVIKHDRGGRGFEIVKEINICPSCVASGGGHGQA